MATGQIRTQNIQQVNCLQQSIPANQVIVATNNLTVRKTGIYLIVFQLYGIKTGDLNAGTVQLMIWNDDYSLDDNTGRMVAQYSNAGFPLLISIKKLAAGTVIKGVLRTDNVTYIYADPAYNLLSIVQID